MSTLPAGWQRCLSKELLEFVTSGSRGWAQYYASDGAAFLRVGNLNHGTITLDLRNVQRVRPPEDAEGERTKLRSGDILISITAELGMVGLVPEQFETAYINQHVALARPHSGLCAGYLAWFFATEGKAQLLKMQRGATKAGLGLDDIRSVDVILPPLEEQHRIVAKLDEKLAHARRAREELERVPRLIAGYKRALLAAAFSGELTRNWRHENGLGDAEPRTVGELVTDMRYGTAQKCYPEMQGTAVLRIPNISAGAVDLSELKYAELTSSELDRLKLRSGDILVIRSNGSPDLVGRVALVDESAAGLAYAGYLIRLRPNTDIVDTRYLVHILGSPPVRKIIETGARSTSGVHNINSVELSALNIPCPSIAEQQEIVRRIEEAFMYALHGAV
jgi:type I restriction enzyme, S subunit